jgi:hypothetical protein
MAALKFAWQERYVQNCIFFVCAPVWMGLSTFLAGKVCFGAFMFSEAVPVDTALVVRK